MSFHKCLQSGQWYEMVTPTYMVAVADDHPALLAWQIAERAALKKLQRDNFRAARKWVYSTIFDNHNLPTIAIRKMTAQRLRDLQHVYGRRFRGWLVGKCMQALANEKRELRLLVARGH